MKKKGKSTKYTSYWHTYLTARAVRRGREREREGHFVKTDNNNYYNFKVVNFNLIFLAL